jgi:hypothetical protein
LDAKIAILKRKMKFVQMDLHYCYKLGHFLLEDLPKQDGSELGV